MIRGARKKSVKRRLAEQLRMLELDADEWTELIVRAADDETIKSILHWHSTTLELYRQVLDMESLSRSSKHTNAA